MTKRKCQSDLAHAVQYARMLLNIRGVENIAMQCTPNAYICVRKQAHENSTHHVAALLTGPVMAMGHKGVLSWETTRADLQIVSRRAKIADTVQAYLQIAADGSTSDDCGILLREPQSAILAALPQAFDAAKTAYLAWQAEPYRLAAVFSIIDQLAPHQCAVLNHAALDCIRSSESSGWSMPIVSFHDWYHLDISDEQESARNEQMRGLMVRLVDDMTARGELGPDGITPAGLARLQLNAE